MTFLPVVERELRVASRNRLVAWQRLGLVFLVFLLVGGPLLTQEVGAGTRTRELFGMLTQLCFFVGVYYGLSQGADRISRETREGTLGLLFLTDLKGYDIVLGKLAGAMMVGFYALLAILPVFSVVLLMGGVTGGEFFHAALALLNGLFCAHAVALLVSSFYRDARSAFSTAISVFLLGTLLVPLLQDLPWRYCYELFGTLAFLSPHQALVHAFSLSGRATANRFWVILLSSHAFAWLCLAGASWRVRDCWREKDTHGAQWLRGYYWRTRLLASTAARRRRRRLLEINPYFWFVSRDPLQKLWIWCALGTVAAVFSMIVWAAWDSLDLYKSLILVGILLGGGVKLMVASEATQQVARLKKSGELEMMLCATPLAVEDIVRGHWLALERVFQWPVLFILILDTFTMLWGGFSHHNRFSISLGAYIDWAGFCIMPAVMIVLLVDLWALASVGMWIGISTPRGTRPNSLVPSILVAPWLMFGLMLPLPGFRPTFGEALVLWLLICIGNDVFWVLLTRNKLISKFRFLAMSYVDERAHWLARIGRFLGHAWGMLVLKNSARFLPPARRRRNRNT